MQEKYIGLINSSFSRDLHCIHFLCLPQPLLSSYCQRLLFSLFMNPVNNKRNSAGERDKDSMLFVIVSEDSEDPGYKPDVI